MENRTTASLCDCLCSTAIITVIYVCKYAGVLFVCVCDGEGAQTYLEEEVGALAFRTFSYFLTYIQSINPYLRSYINLYVTISYKCAL